MNSRSTCPINFGVEAFGDKWTLLIIRDLLDGKKYYREFLQSDEKIATNILADRLEKLEKEGLITKQNDEHHKQKIVYSLTEKGIDLLPILIEMAAWSVKYKPVDKLDMVRVNHMKKGGLKLIDKIKKLLKKEHITAPKTEPRIGMKGLTKY